MQLCKLFGFLSVLILLLLLLLLLLAPGRWLAFAIDLLERTNFRKEHIALGASSLSVRPDVFRPKVIGQQLVWFRIELFECDQMVDLLFATSSNLFFQHQVFGRIVGEPIRQPDLGDAKIISDFHPNGQFF